MDNRQLQAENGTFFSWLPPGWAAFARGIVLAVLGAVLTALVAYLESGDNLPGGIAPYLPIIILILRTLEGQLDRKSVKQ